MLCCKRIAIPQEWMRCDAQLWCVGECRTRFRHLLQSLATTTKFIMGNTQASESSADPFEKGYHQGSGSRRWVSTRSADEPPDFLVKLAKILIVKSLAEDHLDGITENVFLKYVSKGNKALGKRLFRYFITHWQEPLESGSTDQPDGNFRDLLSKGAFLSSSNYFLGLLSDADQLEFFIKVFAGNKEKIEEEDVYELVLAAYQIAQLAHQSCCLPDDILMAVVKAVMHGKESISTKYFQSWVTQHCPRLVMWAHRYIAHMFTVGHRTIPLNTDEEENDTDTPILDCSHASSCISLHPALIWLLTCTLPTLYTKQQKSKSLPSSNSLMLDPHIFLDRMISAASPTHWIPLYNSDNHGLSINRFQHHVFGYHGPTLMFITTEDGNMFCLACDENWRDSKHFWGGEHSCCLHLTPEYKVIERGVKMMYFNVTSRGFPTGIHVGTNSSDRALTLDLDLTLLTYRRIPMPLHSIEVWGCGTTETKEAQTDLKKREVNDSESRRKVNLNKVDWVDNPDRYLIELAGARPTYAQYDKDTQGKSSKGSS